MTWGRLLVPGVLILTLAWSGRSQETDRPEGAAELPRRADRRDWAPGLIRTAVSGPALGNASAVLGASGYYGDHIVNIGDGGEEAVRLYGVRNVGFKFTVVSLACFHLWTWGGTYCVYEPVFEDNRLTDKHKVITKAEAARLLHKDEGELTAPFWYRFPPGMLLLIVLFPVTLISAVARRAKKPRPPADSIGEAV
jgi:hypothetical protein